MCICKRCGSAAENYITEFGEYLCDDCYVEYKNTLHMFWEAFIHSDNTMVTHQCRYCQHEGKDCIDYPCNSCRRAIYGLKTDMFEAKEN